MSRTSPGRVLIAVVALAWSACSDDHRAPGAPDAAPSPDVLLILVDTLRRDHLSLYGYSRETPAIDALGASGWVFDNHVTHASQTVPSTISMMVSQYPAEHGHVHGGPGHFSANPPLYGDELLFLAEAFRQAGYATAGFVANPFLQEKNGFDQGFDHFAHDQRGGRHLTRAASRWIHRHLDASDPPFFVYLHYMDVHSPYEPPTRYRGLYPGPREGKLVYRNGPAENASPADVEVMVGLYDAQIRYIDDQIAWLLARVERLGGLENTIVALTADHGDEFLEHGGLGHGTSVYGELVRVPLVVSHPGKLAPGRRVEHMTRHIDLAPTLLEMAGISRPDSFRGASLFSPAEVSYAENGEWRAAYAEGGKIIVNLERGSTELYAESDLLDRAPLDDPALEARLRARLDAYLAQAPSRRAGSAPGRATPEWSEEDLEVLGYID